jgi:hypothetical protein
MSLCGLRQLESSGFRTRGASLDVSIYAGLYRCLFSHRLKTIVSENKTLATCPRVFDSSTAKKEHDYDQQPRHGSINDAVAPSAGGSRGGMADRLSSCRQGCRNGRCSVGLQLRASRRASLLELPVLQAWSRTNSVV